MDATRDRSLFPMRTSDTPSMAPMKVDLVTKSTLSFGTVPQGLRVDGNSRSDSKGDATKVRNSMCVLPMHEVEHARQA